MTSLDRLVLKEKVTMAPKVRFAGAAGLTVASLVGMAQLAQAATEYNWDLEGRPGVRVAPRQAFGSPALYATPSTTLSFADGAHEGSIDFANWRDLHAGGRVHADHAILSTDGDLGDGHKAGTDGGSNAFDPEGTDFSFGASVRPTPASLYPLGTESPTTVSPNIMQKGLASAHGGYWKLYLQMVRTEAGLRWAPVCVMRSGGSKTKVNTGKAPLMLEPGAAYTLSCDRRARTLALTAIREDGPAFTVTAPVEGPLTIANEYAVTVGKKPGSPDMADAFDGQIDDVRVTKG